MKEDIKIWVVIVAIVFGFGLIYTLTLNSEREACRKAGGVPINSYGGIVNCASKENYIDIK